MATSVDIMKKIESVCVGCSWSGLSYPDTHTHMHTVLVMWDFNVFKIKRTITSHVTWHPYSLCGCDGKNTE